MAAVLPSLKFVCWTTGLISGVQEVARAGAVLRIPVPWRAGPDRRRPLWVDAKTGVDQLGAASRADGAGDGVPLLRLHAAVAALDTLMTPARPGEAPPRVLSWPPSRVIFLLSFRFSRSVNRVSRACRVCTCIYWGAGAIDSRFFPPLSVCD
jgi:hypothetical protein